ncbi:Transcriptional regulator Sir2 family [Paragonimus heterotremus]|uniref:Transcriptional regulator Sir2 family n=1 Tax=Paragonimus heterotremus TaxID=100268 RepID=A0A8J4WDX6_9TREM|nr:Transcriptional regulator Sir2 family [Paragonimus heterotremus]
MLGPLYSSFFRCHIVPKFAIKTLSNSRGLLSLGCCMCSDSSAKTDPSSVLSHVADHILEHNVRRILVLAGAGISTDSGIPDFRTPGSGLYDNLSQYNLPWPEAVFDLQYFYSDPVPFYSLAKELYPSGRYRPNVAHYFIRLLHEKSRLLRCYTQNIDSLERSM